MPERAPFSWIDSPGWIALSGPADAHSEVRAQALSRYDNAGDIAYVSLAADLADALMDDMAELGAPAGYLVDPRERDNNEIYERLRDAGLVVIDAAGDADTLLRLLRRTAVHALKEALNRGALILFEADAATLAGDAYLAADGAIRSGLKVVSGALIASDISSVASHDELHCARMSRPELAVIGLPRGAALALGPDGRIETWGLPRVAISLGDLALDSLPSA